MTVGTSAARGLALSRISAIHYAAMADRDKPAARTALPAQVLVRLSQDTYDQLEGVARKCHSTPAGIARASIEEACLA